MSRILLYGIGGALALGAIATYVSTRDVPAAKSVPLVAALSPPLPSFEFRGLRPGVTKMADAQKSGALKECEDLYGERRCEFAKASIGDVPVYGYESAAIFEKGVLDWFNIPFSTEHYPELKATLTATYGQPCGSRTVNLQNGFGAQFQGEDTYWCFREGSMTLHQHATGRNGANQGELDFFTKHTSKPVKNYDRNAL